MVHTDIGDDGENGCQHIGAVESSSESHFDDRYVHLLRNEICKRHRGHGLEERGLSLVQKRLVLRDKPRYFFFGDRRAVDADAFGQRDQMRAGVESHFVSRGLEDCSNEMGGRTFAVRACHMYRAQLLVRVTQMRHETECVLQPRLVRRASHHVKWRTRRVQICYCFAIIHQLFSTTLKSSIPSPLRRASQR